MSGHLLLSIKNRRRLQGAAIFGGLVLAAGVLLPAIRERTWGNLLVGTFFLLTLSLGGAVFVALTYVTGAGWSVAFRRIPEAMAKILPITGAAMLAVLAVNFSRYDWHHHGGGDAGTFWFKELWLTPPFWLGRAVFYVVIWSLMARWLVARSQRQDQSGDPAISVGNTRLSAVFLAVYGITFSLACIDWLMALKPMWFSTMWGVYGFSGMIQATLATVIILGLVLRLPGQPLHGIFSDEHLHDLGKLLIGFSCFWMYIWFSQYMLIWYSNIPEETSYFITRTHGPWGPVVIVSIMLSWVIPFFVLLPRPAKRSAGVMMKVAVVVLAGRWVDLGLIVFPALMGGTPVFGIGEAMLNSCLGIATAACLIGTGGLLFFRAFASMDPLPRQDPYLAESLHYHAS